MLDTTLLASVEGYDLLLGLIALPLVGASLATWLLSVSPAAAAGVGSLTASGGVAYALFRAPPVTGGAGRVDGDGSQNR